MFLESISITFEVHFDNFFEFGYNVFVISVAVLISSQYLWGKTW